jgi:hypothetical protein
VVLDNLSTHSPGALYQTFPPDQARRILRRLEFHYVPKHASWLNMVEIGSASWPANASIDASTATLGSSPKPQPGKSGATPNALASNGCSQPKEPAPKWAAPIPNPLPN